MSIASILDIAKNAMYAHQTSIHVTSNNIANVNTRGYARQEAILEEGPSVLTDLGRMGTGVTVAGFRRYYDRFLEATIAQRNTDLEEQKTMSAYLERIETIVNEDNSQLATRITEFFNGWQELSNDPLNLVKRTNVVTKAKGLSQTISNMYNELNAMRLEVDSNIEKEISEINGLTSSIADLNRLIYENGGGNGETLDYETKRTQLIKELSGKLNIVTFTDEDGGVSILTGTGQPLVSRATSWNLEAIEDPTTGLHDIGWMDASGSVVNITTGITGGTLKGLVDTRDEYLGNGFMKDLNELARTLITDVNTIHESGYNMNGTTGFSFFEEVTSGCYARDIDLSSEITADVRYIAAASSSSDTSGNEAALDIASLLDENLTINGQTTTFTNYVSSMMSNIGELTRNSKNLCESQQYAMNAIENQRESVSGVSIDEEMSNLVKFQTAYQASARLVTVADELFQTFFEAFK